MQKILLLIFHYMISIIVPVYNSASTLPNCIESLLTQTYPDFEILLIDDGSKDTSSSLCDMYMSQDSRIRTFHKVNGGVSSARNLGIKQAKGEYITFCDADDSFEPDALSFFYNTISQYNPDIIRTGYKKNLLLENKKKLNQMLYILLQIKNKYL